MRGCEKYPVMKGTYPKDETVINIVLLLMKTKGILIYHEVVREKTEDVKEINIRTNTATVTDGETEVGRRDVPHSDVTQGAEVVV